ncbi:MAG: glycosyltransferase, partial [Pseudomonadota bacterium]
MSKHLVIAAGGTGGHMFPAQALAEEMLARGWTVALSTDDRGLRFAGGFPEAVERLATRAATPARGGVAGAVTAPARILAGAGDAAAAFRRRRPAVVAGFGGYPSLPALLAAWRIGAPRMIHEQNGVLGRVNRLFDKRVGEVALGVEPVLNAPAGAPLIYTGNPLRRAALEHVGRAYAPPPPEGPINLLIFGGSQGARIFSRAIPGALAKAPDALRARLRITQQTRPEDQAETARA